MQKNYTRSLFHFAILFFLLTGCTGTAVLYSNVFDKSVQPITELRVLYLENKLSSKQSPILASGNPMLASIGYDDLGHLFHERVPLVFNMNGIAVEVESIKRAEFGKAEVDQMAIWAQKDGKAVPVMVLQIVDGSSITNTRYGSTVVYLNLHANLINPATKRRMWTGQFQNTLSIALLGKIAFDNQFVDKMLKEILEQMVKDRLIALPNGEVLIPAVAVAGGNKS